MLVVAVIAILAAIALPSFLDQVRKARRSDAKQPIMDFAAKLEQYYQDNKGYPVGTSISDKNNEDLGFLSNEDLDPDVVAGETNSLEGYYAVSTTGTATRYTITARPLGDQKKDKTCQTFRLDHLGNKTVTKGIAKDCW